MALNIGELVGTLAIDGSEFRGGLGDALGDFEGFGGKLGVLAGAAGAAAGAALAAGFLAMDLEKSNDKLAAQLRLTEDESARVGAVAGDLYANAYGESMDQVNEALRGVIGQMGDLGDITDQELSAAGAAALDLATIIGTDVTRVTQIAGQAVKTGMAKDFTEALDIIAAASAETMPGLQEDLLDASDEYGPFFQALGFDGERAFGLLAAASQKGMYGIDKAGDAIKEFTIRATDMSEATVGAYGAIGLDADKMADALLAGGDKAAGAFDKIVNGLLGIKDPSERANTAIALFGTPLEDLSVQEIPTFLESLTSAGSKLGDTAGAADEMGKTLNDNASTNLATFGRTMQTWFVDTIGGKVLPILSDFASFLATTVGPALTTITDWISTTGVPAVKDLAYWIAENKTPIMIIVGVITVFLLPAIIAWGVQSVIAGGKAVGAWAVAQAKAVASSAVQVASMWRVIGAWAIHAGKAVAHGAVIAGVWAAQQGKAIASVAVQAGQLAVLGAKWLWSTGVMVTQAAIQAGIWVAQKAQALLSMGITVASVVGGWIVMAATSLIGAASMALAWFIALGPVGWVIAAIVGLVALIIIFWDDIKRITVEVFTAVWEWIKGAFDKVMEIIHMVIDWVAENWPLILAIITGPFGLAVYFVLKFKDDIIAAVKGAIEWVIGKFGDLVDFVKSLPSKIGRAASGLWDSLKTTFKSAINALIRIWNDFSLTIGGGNILGVDIPSVTLNTPDLPYLATGGTALTAGAAVVGERGPEIRHLERGATVETLEHAASRTRIDSLERRIDRLAEATARTGGIMIENLNMRTLSDRLTPQQFQADIANLAVR